MAEEEAGKVVVKVGMDGTGFQEGISNINRQMRLIQSEFQAASAQLGKFGDSAEGLQLRSDSLAKQMDLQKQKVAALEAAYQKAAESKGLDAKATQELAIKLNKAKAEMAGMENELNDVNEQIEQQANKWNQLSKSLADTQQAFQAVGDQMSGIGGALSATLTAGIVALGAAAGKAAGDFDQSTGRIQSALGVTAEDAEQLGTVAQSMWKDAWGDSLADVTDSLVLVKQNMKDLVFFDDSSLDEAVMSAHTLRDAFNVDVSESTRTASVLMRNFGIDSQQAFDIMTVGLQQGGNFSDELLDTLSEYSPQFKAMGISANDMLGILIEGANAGAFNLDKVGDAVKEFNIRAKDGSKTTADGFKALGLDAAQMGAAIAQGGEAGTKAFQATIAALAAMDDPVQQGIAGVALFGTQWEDLESTVVTSMASGIGSITGLEGATQRAGDALRDNIGIQATAVWREFQAALAPLGAVMIDFAEQILPQLAAAVQVVSGWFAELSPAGQQIAVVIGAIAAAIGPALVIIGQLVAAVSSIIGAFSAVSGAVAAAGGAMALLTGPIGLTVAAVTGLATAAYLVIDNWSEIKTFFADLWQSVQETWSSASDELMSILDNLQAEALSIWNAITSQVMGIVFPLVDRVVSIFEELRAGITQVLDGLSVYFQAVWDIYKNIFLGALLLLVDLVTLNFTDMQQHAEQIMGNLRTSLGVIWDGIKTIFTAVGAFLGQLWQQIKAQALEAWTSLQQTTITLVQETDAGIRAVWEGILAWFAALPETLMQYGINMFTALQQGITVTLPLVVQSIHDGLEAAWTYIKGLPALALQWGKDIIDGLVNGITEHIGRVRETMRQTAESIKSSITDTLGIRSPSRVTREYGRNVSQGLALGIDDEASKAAAAAKELADKIRGEAVEGLSQLGEAVKKALQNRYAAEERMQTDSLRRQTEENQKASRDIIAGYEEQYLAKLKVLDLETAGKLGSIQEQIDAIDGVTKAEEKALAEQAYLKALADKQKELAEAQTAEQQARIHEEMKQMVADHERKLLLEQRQLQIEHLQHEMEQIREQAELKKEQLKQEFDLSKANVEAITQTKVNNLNAQIEATKSHYAELAAEEALQAEMRRLILNENNEELIELLESYNPKWQDAGQAFGESLLDGMNSMKQSIQDAVNEMLQMVNQARYLSDLMQNGTQGQRIWAEHQAQSMSMSAPSIAPVGQSLGSGMSGAISQIRSGAQAMAAAVLPAMRGAAAGAGTAVAGAAAGMVVNQTNHFSSPLPLTPAETARRNLQVSRQLVMEWGS